MQYSQTRYEDSLSLGIGDTDLSLNCFLVPPTRTQGILTIGRLQGNTEDVYYTNVVANTVTIALRGLSTTALTPTQVIINRKVHNANESLEITTHHLYDTNKTRVDENETVSGNWEFTGTETFADNKARSKTNAAPSDEKSFTNKKYVDDQIGGVVDVKVKVSENDTTTGFLSNKMIGAEGVELSIVSPGGNEKLNILNKAKKKTFTAAENITTGQTLGVSNGLEGRVARAIRTQIALTISYAPDSYTNNASKKHCFQIADNKFIFIGTSGADDGASNRNKYVYCVTVDPDTLSATVGTPANPGTTRMSRIAGCKLDENKFIVFLGDYSSAQISYFIYTASGNDLMLRSSGATGVTKEVVNCVSMGVDRCILSGYTTGSPRLYVVTVSTYTFSLGGNYLLTGNMDSGSPELVQHSTDGFTVFVEETNLYARALTISGTNIDSTASNEFNIGNAQNNFGTPCSPADNKVVAFYSPTAGTNYFKLLSITGNVITGGSAIVASTIGQMINIGSTIYYGGICRARYTSNTIVDDGLIVSPSAAGGLVSMGSYYIKVQQPLATASILVHIQGMSNMFSGVATENANRGASVSVTLSGENSNQSGLIPGSYYKANGSGGLSFMSSSASLTPQDKYVLALSSTTILI